MKKMRTILIMLQSINGIISKSENDNLSWGGSSDKANFKKLTTEIGTIIMGSSTFNAMGQRALAGRHTIVLSRNPEKYEVPSELAPNTRLDFSSESPEELLQRLNRPVAIVGGSKINKLFFDKGLINELYITIAPYIFLTGTPLIDFPDIGERDITVEHKFKLNSSVNLSKDTILLHYISTHSNN